MADDLCSKAPLVWDWDIEHADRKSEAKADAAVHGAPPFQVDRKLLKDIVQEKMGEDVVRIRFLGAGTFHKVSGHCDSLAWLLRTLANWWGGLILSLTTSVHASACGQLHLSGRLESRRMILVRTRIMHMHPTHDKVDCTY